MSAGTILFMTYIVAPIIVVVGLFGYLAHSEAKRYAAGLEKLVVTSDEMHQLERQLKKADTQYRRLEQQSLGFKVLGLVILIGTFGQAFALVGALVAGVVFTLARRAGQRSLGLEVKYFKNHKELPNIDAQTWSYRRNLVKYYWLIGMALSIAAFLLAFAMFIK